MKTFPAAAALLLIASACTGTADNDTAASPVPRPRAWPRIAVYPEIYSPVHQESDIETVASLKVGQHTTPDGHRWYDIVYPAYRATLYLSDITPGNEEKVAAALENRMERMALNTGGRTSEKNSFITPAGYEATILITPSGSITPVQFAAAGEHRVVSGTFTLSRLPASADSLAPTLRAVERDIIHLIKCLR